MPHDAEDGGVGADAEREGDDAAAVKPGCLRSPRSPIVTSRLNSSGALMRTRCCGLEPV
jgi:hypothetical protein